MMKISDLAEENNITPFFRLGFRPLFTLGALFSCITLVLWAGFLGGTFDLSLYGGGYFYHTHEMIFGFINAIIVGFLLTAVQNWTGIRSLHSKPLALLVSIWLTARIFMIVPVVANWLIMLIDVSFMLFSAIILARPLIAVKQVRNLFFVPLLVMFAVLNALFHGQMLGFWQLNLRDLAYASSTLVLLLMSIMAGRVTPMFTANGTQTAKVAPLAILEWACTVTLLLIFLQFLLQQPLPTSTTASLFFIAGVCQLIRWLRWRPWITLHVPLLWSLHTSMLFFWVGLIAMSVSIIGNSMAISHIWHLLTVGAMGGLILAMISRVSLGHTGHPLTPAPVMSIAFIAIFISALLRALGPTLMPEKHLLFVSMSSILWLLAYSIFIIKYAPLLLQPRRDGRPG
ncbi:NnrS family protein [Thalassotalea maritima]|uniref:NnrS family protein n=1 Tax=Thalassotalea maritima TaxID=3242416 RepID=UPI003526D22C